MVRIDGGRLDRSWRKVLIVWVVLPTEARVFGVVMSDAENAQGALRGLAALLFCDADLALLYRTAKISEIEEPGVPCMHVRGCLSTTMQQLTCS